MAEPYKILFLEDSLDDIGLMKRELNLANVNYIAKHVCTKEDFLAELAAVLPCRRGGDCDHVLHGGHVVSVRSSLDLVL